MAIELTENDLIKFLQPFVEKVAKDDQYNILNNITSIYENSNTKEEAESKMLQFLHDTYPKELQETPLAKEVSKAISEDKVQTTGAKDSQVKEIPLESIAKMFGTTPEKILLWDDEKHWTKLNTEDMLKQFAENGVDYKAAFKALQDAQERYDRESIIEGYDPSNGERKWGDWVASAYTGLFTPRMKEAGKLGRDPSVKDVALDIGSNIAYAVPVGRFAGLATKAAKPGVRWVSTNIGGAAAVPFAENAADAAAYDDVENPDRGRFRIGTALKGSVVNAVAPKALGAIISAPAEGLGIKSMGEKAERLMRGDPYLEGLERRRKFKVDPHHQINAKDYQDAFNEDVMEQILPVLDNEKLRKNISKEMLKRYRVAQRHPSNKDLMQRRESIYDAGTSVYNPDYNAKFHTGFTEIQPSYVTPTSMLKATDKKFKYNGGEYRPEEVYGIENGNFAVKAPKEEVELAKTLTKNHNYPLVKTEKSLSDEFVEQARKIENTPNADKYFPISARPTKADEAIEAMYNNPEFMDKVRSRQFSYKLPGQIALGYAVNKAGREKFAETYIPTEVVDYMNFTSLPVEVRKYLSDPVILRQWDDARFKPKEIEGDPKWEAWKIYKRIKEN